MAREFIPYGRQDIRQQDIDSVVEVLTSDFLTQGPIVPRFEDEVARKVGAKFAVAVNSATSALHLACLALGLGKGDYLWSSPITFVASLNCALYCGAQVDFVDINPSSFNLCPQSLKEKLEIAKKQNKVPKVIVTVHFTGQSCEMDSIRSIANDYGIKIIEDASHAIGGKYRREYIGSCRYSDVAVFSFHPVKIITTGEGGMAVTNDSVLADAMRSLSSHGITRDHSKMKDRGQIENPWYYEQLNLGFNYRLTEMQAALGLSQLNRLDEYVAVRNNWADNYDKVFENTPVRTPAQSPECYSSRHLYIVRINPKACGITRNKLFNLLRDANIGVNVHYIPVHLQPYYYDLGFREGDYVNAESFYREALTLPLHPNLDEVQFNYIIDTLLDALRT